MSNDPTDASIDTRVFAVVSHAGMRGLTVSEIVDQTRLRDDMVHASLARLDGSQAGARRVMPIVLVRGEVQRYASYTPTADEKRLVAELFHGPQAREQWRQLGAVLAPDDPRFRK